MCSRAERKRRRRAARMSEWAWHVSPAKVPPGHYHNHAQPCGVEGCKGATPIEVIVGTANPVHAFTSPREVIAAFGPEVRNPDDPPGNASAAACDAMRSQTRALAVVKVGS